MKEIKQTKTIEEITGYEAIDGTVFGTKEACIRYEQSAECAIQKAFNGIMIKEVDECTLYREFCYGSEYYSVAILDIKDVTDLEVANRFYSYHGTRTNDLIPSKYIGKRIMVNYGEDGGINTHPYPRTLDEFIDSFRKSVSPFFKKDDEE